jgi:hypothetical protein
MGEFAEPARPIGEFARHWDFRIGLAPISCGDGLLGGATIRAASTGEISPHLAESYCEWRTN